MHEMHTKLTVYPDVSFAAYTSRCVCYTASEKDEFTHSFAIHTEGNYSLLMRVERSEIQRGQRSGREPAPPLIIDSLSWTAVGEGLWHDECYIDHSIAAARLQLTSMTS